MNKLTEMYLNAEYDELFRFSENLSVVRKKDTGILREFYSCKEDNLRKAA